MPLLSEKLGITEQKAEFYIEFLGGGVGNEMGGGVGWNFSG